MCLLVRLCKKAKVKVAGEVEKKKNSDMIHYCFEEDQATQ